MKTCFSFKNIIIIGIETAGILRNSCLLLKWTIGRRSIRMKLYDGVRPSISRYKTDHTTVGAQTHKYPTVTDQQQLKATATAPAAVSAISSNPPTVKVSRTFTSTWLLLYCNINQLITYPSLVDWLQLCSYLQKNFFSKVLQDKQQQKQQ